MEQLPQDKQNAVEKDEFPNNKKYAQRPENVDFSGCTASELAKVSPQQARTQVLEGKILENILYLHLC